MMTNAQQHAKNMAQAHIRNVSEQLDIADDYFALAGYKPEHPIRVALKILMGGPARKHMITIPHQKEEQKKKEEHYYYEPTEVV